VWEGRTGVTVASPSQYKKQGHQVNLGGGTFRISTQEPLPDVYSGSTPQYGHCGWGQDETGQIILA